jgi:hypothetical protein
MTACNLKYDYSKIEFIIHHLATTIDNVAETVEEGVPKLSNKATPYEILKFLNTFDGVCTNLSWTTGPKLFQKFQLHLKDHHYDLWEPIIVDVTKNISQFNKCLGECKTELLEGYTYEHQMDYLREIKKPSQMQRQVHFFSNFELLTAWLLNFQARFHRHPTASKISLCNAYLVAK